jgi:type II secretory pathway component PulF
LHILSTAEQSGKLAGSLLHIAKLESETISLENEMLAEWLPRLAYVMVALWMAYSILSHGGVKL